MVSVAVHVKADDPLVKHHRELICDNVLRRFSGVLNEVPLNQTVICLIDDQDFPDVKLICGETNRGFRLELKGAGLWLLPQHFHNLVRPIGGPPHYSVVNNYDQVVYLHGSTSQTDIGLTLTLAHELQHVVQSVTASSIIAVNEELKRRDRPWSQDFKEWRDLPVEKDARIVAKGTAEALYGKAEIRDFLIERIESQPEDIEDWKFVLRIDAGLPYDPITETEEIVRKWNITNR